MKKQQAEGFTLIELMIVIVIIGILAAIAYPAYVDQVRKGRRADCTGVLTGLAASMERNFTENNTYLALGSAGATGAPISTLYANKCPISPLGVKYYDLDITAATATTYRISAIPVPGSDQAEDKCKTLTLTNTGIKGITGTGTVSRCW